jgi:Fe-S cluster assembly ATP-binding protein
LLNYIKPSRVHVLIGGQIARSGGPELAEELEAEGYAGIAKELGLESEILEAEEQEQF